MADDREKKLAKLRKLLALANGNANTHEAMVAIGKIQALRAEYGFTAEEIERGDFEKEGKFGSRFTWSADKGFGFCDRYLVFTIATFCGVAAGGRYNKNGETMVGFYGEEADVDLAYWLRQTIIDAMAFEWMVYRKFVHDPKDGNIYDTMTDFHKSMAGKLRARMTETYATEVKGNKTVNALVVKTMAIVTEKAAQDGFEFLRPSGRASYSTRPVNQTATAMGRDAGGRVNLGRGVAGGGTSVKATPRAIAKQ